MKDWDVIVQSSLPKPRHMMLKHCLAAKASFLWLLETLQATFSPCFISNLSLLQLNLYSLVPILTLQLTNLVLLLSNLVQVRVGKWEGSVFGD